MDQFNLKASGDSKLFRENNGAKKHRLDVIIEKGRTSIDMQLVKDFMQMYGLDIVNNREEVMALCQELGVDPKMLGIAEEVQVDKIMDTKLYEGTHQIDNDGRDEK